jgi:hypothetical protein
MNQNMGIIPAFGLLFAWILAFDIQNNSLARLLIFSNSKYHPTRLPEAASHIREGDQVAKKNQIAYLHRPLSKLRF